MNQFRQHQLTQNINSNVENILKSIFVVLLATRFHVFNQMIYVRCCKEHHISKR